MVCSCLYSCDVSTFTYSSTWHRAWIWDCSLWWAQFITAIQPFLVVASLLVFVLLSISIINTLQRKKSKVLPVRLRNWKWLPLPLRSLKPYDDVFCSKCTCCVRTTSQVNDENAERNGHTNESYQPADEQPASELWGKSTQTRTIMTCRPNIGSLYTVKWTDKKSDTSYELKFKGEIMRKLCIHRVLEVMMDL